MSIEVTVHIRKCPICRKKLVKPKDSRTKAFCENSCYSIFTTGAGTIESIFGKCFVHSMEDTDEEIAKMEKVILEKIKYWKKNDRYLAEILARET